MIQAARHSDADARRPTICHVIHALGVGGAEVLVDSMVRRMDQRFRCMVAVLDDVGEIGERLQNDGFTVFPLHRKPGIDRACGRRLREFADSHHVDILHAHQYTPFFQAMLSRRFFGTRPVLLTEHGRHFPDIPSRKRSVVNRILLKRQDRLVGCGNSVRQALVDNEGLPQNRVEVVYNGVDLKALASGDPNQRQPLRAQFGFSESDFVAIQVARLHDLKDHITAVRTISEARKNSQGIKLLIVGEGDERPAIEAEILKHNLQNDIILAGNRSNIPDLLAAADGFLMTSISEGIPLTIVEAMAAGLPVVATSVGGIPEMIEHGKTGFLSEARNARSLADHLVDLSRNDDLRAMIVQQARVQAEARFSLDSMLQSYSKIYEEMMQDG